MRGGRHAVAHKEVICASNGVAFQVGEANLRAPLVDLGIIAHYDTRSRCASWDQLRCSQSERICQKRSQYTRVTFRHTTREKRRSNAVRDICAHICT